MSDAADEAQSHSTTAASHLLPCWPPPSSSMGLHGTIVEISASHRVNIASNTIGQAGDGSAAELVLSSTRDVYETLD